MQGPGLWPLLACMMIARARAAGQVFLPGVCDLTTKVCVVHPLNDPPANTLANMLTHRMSPVANHPGWTIKVGTHLRSPFFQLNITPPSFSAFSLFLFPPFSSSTYGCTKRLNNQPR